MLESFLRSKISVFIAVLCAWIIFGVIAMETDLFLGISESVSAQNVKPAATAQAGRPAVDTTTTTTGPKGGNLQLAETLVIICIGMIVVIIGWTIIGGGPSNKV